jgi:hypothetical protein
VPVLVLDMTSSRLFVDSGLGRLTAEASDARA